MYPIRLEYRFLVMFVEILYCRPIVFGIFGHRHRYPKQDPDEEDGLLAPLISYFELWASYHIWRQPFPRLQGSVLVSARWPSSEDQCRLVHKRNRCLYIDKVFVFLVPKACKLSVAPVRLCLLQPSIFRLLLSPAVSNSEEYFIT